MSLTRFKLANILLEPQEHYANVPELLFRSTDATTFDASDGSLEFEGFVDFLTYFNSLSCEKWNKYTSIEDFKLHIEVKGDPCKLGFIGVGTDAVKASDCPDAALHNQASTIAKDPDIEVDPDVITTVPSSDFVAYDLGAPTQGLLLCGFYLESEGKTSIRNAYWYADVDEEFVRPVNIALVTTTFNNEQYVIPNIDAVKENILASEEAIADGFHMFVIDNGRTLDVDAVSTPEVTVIPNPNSGGAGGFARGMIAALESDEQFTHVLLMDDDVKVSTESFLRTFNLLSLRNAEYEDAFLNGAMLEIDRPDKQVEDVAHVLAPGRYIAVKGNLYMGKLSDVAVNEKVDVEVPDAYGAWWYSCIPMKAIKEHGLPMPFFVRCDDVEYGLRCNPTYMTMNGICVWHAAFGGRYRASIDCYQYIRNFMITLLYHEPAYSSFFLRVAERFFRMFMRGMAYETGELIVMALEDYLKGPKYLMGLDGEEVIKKNGAMNEKLHPIEEELRAKSEEYPELAEALLVFEPEMERLSEGDVSSKVMKVVRSLPYDRHMLPDALLSKDPTTIYYGGWGAHHHDQVARSVMVACDREGKNAHVRIMDRERWKALMDRWNEAKAFQKEHGEEIEQAYKDAFEDMTSVDFWKSYLGVSG